MSTWSFPIAYVYTEITLTIVKLYLCFFNSASALRAACYAVVIRLLFDSG